MSESEKQARNFAESLSSVYDDVFGIVTDENGIFSVVATSEIECTALCYFYGGEILTA